MARANTKEKKPKQNQSCAIFSTGAFVKKVFTVPSTTLKMTARTLFREGVRIHGVESDTGQFASIGCREDAFWKKTVSFYTVEGWMTKAIATAAELGIAALTVAAVDRGPGDSNMWISLSMTYMAV